MSKLLIPHPQTFVCFPQKIFKCLHRIASSNCCVYDCENEWEIIHRSVARWPPGKSHIFILWMQHYGPRLGGHHHQMCELNPSAMGAFIRGMIMEIYETEMEWNYQKLNWTSFIAMHLFIVSGSPARSSCYLYLWHHIMTALMRGFLVEMILWVYDLIAGLLRKLSRYHLED